MDLPTTLFALSAVLLLASTIIFERRLSRTEQRLNALRSNCSIRNERGQMLRYVNASPEVRARAETN